MAARANGNDNNHTPQSRTPMLPSDNLQDWFMQTIKMTAFSKKRVGVEAVWKMKVPVGTMAQVT